jgi:hypothetical protein
MRDHLVREALSGIAADAVPETIDLWPAISRTLSARRVSRAPQRLARRPLILAAAAALVVVVGWTLVGPSSSGLLSTVQAADVARSDPEVAALLRGDISLATVTQVVNQVATVVVQDSHGKQVTVLVDLRSRIATVVYQGPQLSPALTAQAIAIVRADPRTSALLARGATLGRITPVEVTHEGTDPTTGKPTQATQTWAQVPFELDGKEWVASVDLALGKIDQLLDPHGAPVPLP